MKLNLLLADDDITTVNHLQEIIERELAGQFSIFTASDGLMALKRLKETKMHIIISDIRMPGCDGIQLLTTLREYAYGCEIIMLSGYDDYNLIRNAMKSGAWDYLLKPVSIPDLTALLEEVSQKMDPNAVVGFPAEYEPKMDLSESSDASFWDGSGKNTGKEGSEQELKDKLDAAALAVVSVCRERAQTCLKQFFSEVLNTSVKRDQLRTMLTDFVYALMQQSQLFIRIVASYKLTDRDIMACIKSLPTFLQLQERFMEIIDCYIEDAGYQMKQNEHAMVRQVQDYLKRHLHENVTMEEMAHFVGLHPNYFSTVFGREAGITFRDYLRAVRVEKAKELLREGFLKIQDIALMVGYQDAPHFNRAFKEVTGLSPSLYRKQNMVL